MLLIQVKSVCILNVENLFQGILHHIFSVNSLHWNRGVITTPLSAYQKLEKCFKYKTLLTVTKRHLAYRSFTGAAITERRNTGENDISSHSLNGLKRVLPSHQVLSSPW